MRNVVPAAFAAKFPVQLRRRPCRELLAIIAKGQGSTSERRLFQCVCVCVCVCVRACARVFMRCVRFQQHWWFVACVPAQRTHVLAHVTGPHCLANNFATPVGCAPHLLAARSQTMPIRTYTAHMCLHKLLAHTCWRISRQLSSDGLPSTCCTCQQKARTRSLTP